MTLLFAAVAAGTSGGAAPVTVETTITGDRYRYYPASQTVGFPAVMSGEEVRKYENTSLQEFARWEAQDIGVEQVRTTIADGLGLVQPRGFTSGVTGSGIEIAYVQYSDSDQQQSYSYDDLVAATPRSVDATVHFRGETVDVTVPVTVDTTQPIQGDALDAANTGGSGEPVDMPDNQVPELVIGGVVVMLGAAAVYGWRRRRQ
jgi:hypothetical protein